MLSVTNLYLYCYAGATVTINCLKYSETLFEKDWYLMAVDLQKYLILMIRSTHRPLVFNGYGILKLNLETFTQVKVFVLFFFRHELNQFLFMISDTQNCNELLYHVQNHYRIISFYVTKWRSVLMRI